jgi:hypothetical protein
LTDFVRIAQIMCLSERRMVARTCRLVAYSESVFPIGERRSLC